MARASMGLPTLSRLLPLRHFGLPMRHPPATVPHTQPVFSVAHSPLPPAVMPPCPHAPMPPALCPLPHPPVPNAVCPAASAAPVSCRPRSVQDGWVVERHTMSQSGKRKSVRSTVCPAPGGWPDSPKTPPARPHTIHTYSPPSAHTAPRITVYTSGGKLAVGRRQWLAGWVPVGAMGIGGVFAALRRLLLLLLRSLPPGVGRTSTYPANFATGRPSARAP